MDKLNSSSRIAIEKFPNCDPKCSAIHTILGLYAKSPGNHPQLNDKIGRHLFEREFDWPSCGVIDKRGWNFSPCRAIFPIDTQAESISCNFYMEIMWNCDESRVKIKILKSNTMPKLFFKLKIYGWRRRWNYWKWWRHLRRNTNSSWMTNAISMFLQK